MENVTFKLNNYHFTRASFDFNIPNKAELNVSFNPDGVFHTKDSLFKLKCEVVVTCGITGTEVVRVSCVAFFSFNNVSTIDMIPEYFYPNSLAIIFPYIRAFVSTLTLQANIQPVVLPTVNLMGLTEILKQNTEIV